jgi:[Skp1-protein]-hydroxyproline N-acetylglucosaminyltransferase
MRLSRSNSSSHAGEINNKDPGGPKHHHRASSSASSYDRPLLSALMLLIGVYTVVTVATYWKVSNTHDSYVPAVPADERQRRGMLQKQQQPPQKPAAPIEQVQRMFPIHVGDDVEVIPHPGMAMAAAQAARLTSGSTADRALLQSQSEQQNANKATAAIQTTMTVPKFFDESHGSYYFNGVPGPNHTVRHYLGEGEHLMTPEQARSIGSYTPILNHEGTGGASEILIETIYCSIASYRDPECTGTVEDLYARAKYPERIRVAILDQRVNGDPVCARPAVPCDVDPLQALCQYRHLIDAYEMDARLAVGPVFARHLAHRHYRGEYFAMQIDSHVRFVRDWDVDIHGQWRSANNEMAVLSTYLSDIIGSIEPGTHRGIHPGRPIMCASDYEGAGNYKHLRHGQQPEGTPGITGQPTLHPFWAAGFSFARGHFVVQVPYDQYLPMVFQGEEISIGLRGFTYGYDYYAAERSVCYHMYAIKENKERRKKVPLFWENSSRYQGAGMAAMKRLNSIIGMGDFPASEWPQDEIHKYGLGRVRATDKFFATFGIHVKEQKVEQHLCRFVGKPMMEVFLPALRSNGMGLDYDKIHYQFKDPAPGEAVLHH